MNTPEDIDQILDEIVTLPSMPGTLIHVTALLDDPDYSVEDVAKAISADPGITLKTLRLVNSAYYGIRQPITSIEHAIMLLGAKVIRNLVLTATSLETVQQGAEPFFRHSVATAVCLRAMANIRPLPADTTPEQAFIYGLLHDVGKILLEEFMPREWQTAREMACAEEMPLFLAEQQRLGIDHAMVGARLAARWRLSSELVSAIAGHHDLAQSTEPAFRGLAAWTSLANYIAASAGFPCDYPAPVAMTEGAWEEVAIAVDDLPALLEAFFAATPAIEELMEDAKG
ncbi:MAG: HDOD domain-containing protein [Candidatus Hydrogenedentota bacterium]